jgi:hypothetical protein
MADTEPPTPEHKPSRKTERIRQRSQALRHPRRTRSVRTRCTRIPCSFHLANRPVKSIYHWFPGPVQQISAQAPPLIPGNRQRTPRSKSPKSKQHKEPNKRQRPRPRPRPFSPDPILRRPYQFLLCSVYAINRSDPYRSNRPIYNTFKHRKQLLTHFIRI